MFRGGNTVNLDAKGRLALPTRYRGSLEDRCQGQVVLTVHDDGCLLLYPQPDWDEIERKLVRLPNQNKRTRTLQRMLDRAARQGLQVILLSCQPDDYAGLGARTVTLGDTGIEGAEPVAGAGQ